MAELTHRWRIKTRLPERFGQPCRVLARGKLNSILVEFGDGYRTVTSAWSVRRLRKEVTVTNAVAVDAKGMHCPDCGAGMRADGFNRGGWYYTECDRRYSPALGLWGYGMQAGCLARQLAAAQTRIEEGEIFRMKADRNRSYAMFYRQKALDFKARIEALEKIRELAISEWSTWKDVLLSNMTEADWRETMDRLRVPATLAAEEKKP